MASDLEYMAMAYASDPIKYAHFKAAIEDAIAMEQAASRRQAEWLAEGCHPDSFEADGADKGL